MKYSTLLVILIPLLIHFTPNETEVHEIEMEYIHMGFEEDTIQNFFFEDLEAEVFVKIRSKCRATDYMNNDTTKCSKGGGRRSFPKFWEHNSRFSKAIERSNGTRRPGIFRLNKVRNKEFKLIILFDAEAVREKFPNGEGPIFKFDYDGMSHEPAQERGYASWKGEKVWLIIIESPEITSLPESHVHGHVCDPTGPC